MVVAEQKPRLHQVVARSTGDMLATLRQATGRNKRAICKEEKGGRLAPAASGNFVLLDLEYSKFSDVSNEDNETDSLASGKQNAEYHYQRGAGQGHQEDREEDEEEALRRVPLLENDHNIHRGQSRWKSCGWSGDGQHELDCREQDKEHEVTRIGRSASRKSLMESLFSHSSIVNQTKNCDSSNTTTIRNKKDSNSNSNINRDKFHAHQKHRKQHHHPQHNCKHEEENHASQCEDELFLARKDDEVESGGDVEVVVHQGSCCDNNSNTKKKKKPEQCFNGEINNLQQSEKDFSSSPSSSANKRSMKLLSLLSHDDHHDHGEQDHGEHSPEFKGPSFGGQKDADAKERRGRRGEREWKRSSSSSSRFNDGEASSVAQEAIMTSCEFPATTIGNCNRSIEQQQQHHELGERNEKQQRKNQLKKQQLAAAAARKLASSSPILTPTTPNDNYDATADCFGRSNKEPCDATGPTATCDNKKHSSAALLSLLGGGGADEALELSLREKRQHRQQKLASVANVATRNGQVTLTKLPRVERARTQKQLQTAASLKNQRLRSQQQQQPWSSSSLARLANNGQRQSSGPLEPIGARQPLTDRNQLSACPSQDLVVGVATPVSASSLEYFGYSQAGHRHHDEAQQKKKKEKLLPHLASVGSTDGHLNSLELVETASVASPAGLGGHEKHYDDQETADGNDSHLAAQQHNTGELTTAGTGNSAKNNAHELSPGFGFGLASNATTTTTTTKSRSKSEDAAGGGQREAANHPGQRLLSAANAGQLALLLASQGRRLQDSQKQQLEQQQQPPPARRTVTNGMVTAPPSPQLACQLNNGNEHQDHRVEERDDDENGGRNRLSCLVSMDGGQCTGASQNDIRWRDGGVNGCGSQGVEDNCDERRHASSVHQSEPATNAGRRRSERERDDDDQEQIGSGGREGFSVVEIEAPEQMSSDRDQRASWRGQSKEQQQQPEQRQMHRETHDSDYNNGKSVTTRLVDTCASSWRQAALMASPVLSNLAGGSHSGSYKVAQRQRRHQHQVTTAATTSSNPSSQQTNQKRDGNNATGANQYGTSASSKGQDFAEKLACYSLAQVQQRQEQQQREQYQQQTQQGTTTTNTTTNTTTTTASCKQHDRNSRSASQRRLSRPGRSPISLQRQTNARLARHRLKIQQQRQEQLASLALREREQFSREARQQLVQQLYNRQGQLQSQSAVSRTVTVLGNGASGSTISQTNSANNELEIEILPPLEQQRARRYQQRANQISSSSSGKGSLLRDLFERLSGRRSSSPSSSNNELQHQQQNPNSPSGSRATAVALVDFSSQQSSRVLGPRSGHHNSQQQETPSRQSVAIQLCDSNYLNNSRDRHRQAWNSASQRGQRIVSTNMQQLSSGGNHNNNTRAQRQTQSHQMSSKRSSADSAFDSTTTNSSSLSSSSSTSSSASSSTLSLNKPFCKICHLSSTRNGSDKLISPCKCSGTMQYIHCGCLLKWLEISNRTNEKPISCELCSHEYTWHKRFNYRHMKLPKCSTKDILLHMIFVLALGGMLFCALAPLFNRSVRSSSSSSSSMTISDFNSMSMEQAAQQVIPRSREISFGSDHHINKPQQQQQQDRLASNIRPSSLRSHSSGLSTSALPASSSSPNASGRLANDEKFILICAAFFFISFFIAIYTQTNTRDTLYGLIVKFTNMNLTYYITEYDHGITTTNNTETTTKTTTSATRDNNDESPNDRSRMNTTHNYSNHHQHQTSEQNIDISQQQQQQQQQQQHSNGAINSNNKGRVVNKHLYGQSHSLNNGRKASV